MFTSKHSSSIPVILILSISVFSFAACGGGGGSMDADSSSSVLAPTSSASFRGIPIRECDNPDSNWLFCDDFETDGPLVAQGRYFEAEGPAADGVEAGVGLDGSVAFAGNFKKGKSGAGDLKISFGKVPDSYFDKGIQTDRTHREVYYRLLLRFQEGWTGQAHKLSRATVFTSPGWTQAMIAHLWGDENGLGLILDPANCTSGDFVRCAKYNDFSNIRWLGIKKGFSEIHNGEYSDRWLCIESRVKLNDPGESNGVQEFWIDNVLEASGSGYDFVGDYTEYGINAIFLENFWNGGAPRDQSRYFDNIVVSTSRIGCG